MFADPQFWEDEGDSPLLARNHGFVTEQNANLRIARAQSWLGLLGCEPVDPKQAERVTEEKFLRILLKDAERTFVPKDDPVVQQRTLVRQHIHMTNLKIAIAEINDYHQGLGYISAFLALFLEPHEVGAILLHLHRSEKHSKGYFYAEPEAFVRDARVFQKLMAVYYPKVVANIEKWGAVPEMYTTKWFVGLGVHFLPYEFLFDYLELYFRFGTEWVWKFGLAYVDCFQKELTEAPGTSGLMTILRAEDPHANWNLPAECPVAMFGDVMSKALTINLNGLGIPEMRKELGDKVKADCEKAKASMAKAAAEDSDDGICFSDEED